MYGRKKHICLRPEFDSLIYEMEEERRQGNSLVKGFNSTSCGRVAEMYKMEHELKFPLSWTGLTN